MRVVGKRPTYLLAMMILCMMNVWSSQASSYRELLASRILSGFGAAAADATVPAVVGDMVVPQDRGHYLMIFHLAMTGALFVGLLINAYLVREQNWRLMCYFLAIAVGVVFVFAVFTIRETSYLGDDNVEPQKRTHWQWMSLSIGYDRRASFIRTLSDIVTNAAYPLRRRPPDRYHLDTANAPSRRSTSPRVPTLSHYDFRNDRAGGHTNFWPLRRQPDTLDWSSFRIRYASVWRGSHLERGCNVFAGLL